MRKIAVFATGLMFLMTMAAFAQTKAPKKAPAAPAAKTMMAKGTVVSADAGSLVITHKVAGKDESMTFALDAQTKKTGDLVKDAVVTVHYTAAGGTNTATSVTATAPRAAAAKKAPKK